MKNFKSHDQARQLMTKYIKQIEELSNLVTDANRFLAQPEPPKQDSIREQIKKLELNIAGLTQRLEALEQRTKTDEKGVWVTRRWEASMSKLLERLDELERAAQSAPASYDDERCDTEENFNFVYAVAAAYPKLRAVVEAAKQAVAAHSWGGIPHEEANELGDAIAALEEDG